MLLGRGVLRGLAVAPAPLPTPPMPMYLVWHRRHQGDPVHQWLRAELEAVVASVGASVEAHTRPGPLHT